jgi:hypothetical protein
MARPDCSESDVYRKNPALGNGSLIRLVMLGRRDGRMHPDELTVSAHMNWDV